MPGRDLMLVSAFAVILVTVIIQGGTLGWLIRTIRPVDLEPPPPMDLPVSEAAVARAKLAKAEVLAYGADGSLLHPQLLKMFQERARATERYAADAEAFKVNLRPQFEAMLTSIAAGREELIRLHRSGQIEDDVLRDLERDLDLEEMVIALQLGE